MEKKELSLIAPSHIVEELEKKGEYYIEREGILIRLNEQPEEEEKYKKGDRIKLALADKEGWIAGEFEIAEKTNLDWKDGDIMNTVDKEGKLHHFVLRDMMPEDTPEEKEEWEKEFELPDEIEHEDCIEVLADKHKLWEICSWEEPELDPDKVVAFIKQLLEERECRAMEEGYEEAKKDMAVGVGLATDTELPEIVSKIASKLTTK